MRLQKLWALPAMVFILPGSGDAPGPDLLTGGLSVPAIIEEAIEAEPVYYLDDEGVQRRFNADYVTVSKNHTCALTPGNRAYCWGKGDNGKLGNGSDSDRSTPMSVAGGKEFALISAGGSHTCALTPQGEAYCWGAGGSGQLGTGATEDEHKPVPVTGDHIFIEITTGEDHTCALTQTGEAYCWGSGRNGKLGNGSTKAVNVPTKVSGDEVYVNISASPFHTCAVTDMGTASCWGAASYGRLGIGEGVSGSQTTPSQVLGVRNFVMVSVGSAYTCGLTDNEYVFCWGNNVGGMLGDGTTEQRWVPVRVEGNFRFVSVTAAHRHTCAITEMGKAYCWGNGSWGRLGNGSSRHRHTPEIEVSGRHQFADIKNGNSHSCAVNLTGDLFCWGRNTDGQLGNGTTRSRSTPGRVGAS